MTLPTKITAADPEAQSADVVAGNLAHLKALFPEVFTEGKIDFEVLKQLLGSTVDERDEKYGLNWHGKRQARQMALTPSLGTLRPCPEESVDWDTTQNLMIEGDNLEVLKLLRKSYDGKVKLIYIDPPYNTGNDFVYPDNFQDSIKGYLELTGQMEGGQKINSNTEASGRFHTDWLNMMYPRLRLARNLLTADGVILVSIDENEITNLRGLMDEVLGEDNFISCLTWEKGRKNDAKFFSNGHEYVVVYAKSKSYLREVSTLWREEKPGARDIWEKYLELREKYGDKDALIEVDLQTWYSALPKAHPAKKWSRYKRIDQNGPWRDRDISWPGGDGPRYNVVHPVTGQNCKIPEAGWRYSTPEEMSRQIRLGLVQFRADHTEPPFRKAHIRPIQQELESADGDVDDDSESEDGFATQVRGSYLYKQSQVSVKYLRDLFGKKIFNNPKDMDEIARLTQYVTSGDKNALVFDFFSGSGTTGEAIMRLNRDDGGHRRYVLVQLPEPLDPTNKEQKTAALFCDELNRPRRISELTKERLRRASRKVKEETPTFTGDLGFRVLKLDSSNIATWDPQRDNLAAAIESSIFHLKEGRQERDVLFEILLKYGLDLAVPMTSRVIAGCTVHSVGGGVLTVCLADGLTATSVAALGRGILAWITEQQVAGAPRLVFKDSGFDDDVAKTNLMETLKQGGIDAANIRTL
jgi:adenine-specific DNA-methyltransferase